MMPRKEIDVTIMGDILEVIGDAIGEDLIGVEDCVATEPCGVDTLDDALGAISDACNAKRQEISEGVPEGPTEHELTQEARVAVAKVNEAIKQLAQLGITVEVEERTFAQFGEGVGEYPNLLLKVFRVTRI